MALHAQKSVGSPSNLNIMLFIVLRRGGGGGGGGGSLHADPKAESSPVKGLRVQFRSSCTYTIMIS